MPIPTKARSAGAVRVTVGMTWQQILAAMSAVTTSEFQQFFVRVRSAYAKRLDDDRRKNWASEGEAKMEIDSSKERT